MVSKGFDIGDFALPHEQRLEALIPRNLSVEAHQAEHIVNLLQISHSSLEEDLDFLSTLAEILKEKGIPFPEKLNKNSLNSITRLLKEIMIRWVALEEDVILEFKF